jgi:ribose transport system substrate-binding protein
MVSIKRNKNAFIITEIVLAAAAILLMFMMFRESYEKAYSKKVSVIIQNSGENEWTAFKYGLKMAAEDEGLEVYTASTGDLNSAEELQSAIEAEIQNGADAVIVQPICGEETEKMLKNLQKKIPVILIESASVNTSGKNGIATVEPDQYEMGRAMAEELLSDYEGNLEGKKIGIAAQAQDTEAVISREQGFRDVLEDSGAEIIWEVSETDADNWEEKLSEQTRADIIAAMDNNSLVAVGTNADVYNLRGAVVYGIGHSTDAFYYLDTGIVECLIMPDEFQMGYKSMSELAGRLKNYFYKMKSATVEYTAIRREEMFSEENQEIMFMMSQ